MSEGKLIIQRGDEASEWPEPVRRAFVQLCLLAEKYNFNIMCAVGFDVVLAKRGEFHLGTFFSPRASSNPHRAELATDIAALFEKIAERSKQ